MLLVSLYPPLFIIFVPNIFQLFIMFLASSLTYTVNSSFPVIHKVNNVVIFVLLRSEG